MTNPENSPPGQSAAVQILRQEIAKMEAQQEALKEKIAGAQRALSQLLAPSGESYDRIIDMVKVFILRKGTEQSYDRIREHVKKTGGVVIKGDLDHRLRVSLSRAIAAGTVMIREEKEQAFYELSKKEESRLKRVLEKKERDRLKNYPEK